jgi:hypothetical protein
MKNIIDSFLRFLRSSKRKMLLITITIVTTLIISSIIAIWLSKVAHLNIPSLGTIRTLGVEAYWDINLTNKTEAINWGTIWPGSSQNATLYIRSISNLETTLHLNTTNWNPANISNYMNLTWNYNGTTIQPDEIIQVTLTLSASSSFNFINYLITNEVKQFSLDIIISTSEYIS